MHFSLVINKIYRYREDWNTLTPMVLRGHVGIGRAAGDFPYLRYGDNLITKAFFRQAEKNREANNRIVPVFGYEINWGGAGLNLTEIIISKNGKWYFGNAEMFRRNILNILAAHIERSNDGSYCIKLGEDINPITVEDVPFLASGYVQEDSGAIKLVFHDLQEMILEGEQKIYFKGDVPYISFRWEADTRLSRGVYWKLSDFFDFRGEEVYIVPPAGQGVN